jgi:hypothetical protein
MYCKNLTAAQDCGLKTRGWKETEGLYLLETCFVYWFDALSLSFTLEPHQGSEVGSCYLRLSVPLSLRFNSVHSVRSRIPTDRML